MQTVETIIETVFGSDAEASAVLDVGRTAVLNWKAWGYFPARLAVPIWQHAKSRGLSIAVDEIPIFRKRVAAQ